MFCLTIMCVVSYPTQVPTIDLPRVIYKEKKKKKKPRQKL